MNELKIKEVTAFIENDIRKTRIIITENGKDTEIVLNGDGKINVAVQA